MRYYPIFLDLRGCWCAVVGGGRVAERKVRVLLQAGASVRVISPGVTPRLASLATRKKIDLVQRAYRRGYLKGRTSQPPRRSQGERSRRRRNLWPVLVFTATDDPETQRAVARDAEALGALVNLVDDPQQSRFIVPASFAQGDLQVAISTSGASPALARRLRRELQLALGLKYRAYLHFLRESRRRVMESVPKGAERTRILRQLAGKPMLDWWWKGEPKGAAPNLRILLGKHTKARAEDSES